MNVLSEIQAVSLFMHLSPHVSCIKALSEKFTTRSDTRRIVARSGLLHWDMIVQKPIPKGRIVDHLVSELKQFSQ